MTEVEIWLTSLGLERYIDAFSENEIDAELLAQLDHEVLKDIGVSSAGARLRMLQSIAQANSALSDDNGPDSPSEPNRPRTTPRDHSIGEAQRRQLTVMFCDLVGSTSLAEHLELEDYRELLGAYQTASRAAIRRYEGYLARYMGDGLLIYFGYPQAHEDDAERAIRAGLEIVERVHALGQREGRRLEVRIGVATGQVVAGDIIGEGAAEEHAVLGEAPNLAARLQTLAAPGSVVISRATRELIGNLFACEDAGLHALKGIAEPVPAWRVLSSAASQTRFAATRSPDTTHFVGRNSELLMLVERWRRAQDNEGQVVLLSGEPGIGKSRLAHALREEIHTEQHDELHFQCSPYHINSAFYPFVEHIQHGAGIVRDDTAEQRFEKLTRWLVDEDEAFATAASLLAPLLSIEQPRSESSKVEPQEHKRRTIGALVDYFTHVAVGNPTLMLIEDLQWADPTTLEVIGSIVDRVSTSGLLMLITHRPEFMPPWPGRGNVTAHSLTRLSRQHVSDMVMSMSADHPLPESMRHDIVRRTDGVPLFVEELMKTVLEAQKSDPVAHVSAEDQRLSVPYSLQDLLGERLDKLAGVKAIAQMAAVIGREFDYQVLVELSSLAPSQLQDALTQLEAEELVYRQGFAPNATYTFKHALMQDAAYDSLLRDDRERLHGRLAEVLQTQFPQLSARLPELLAHHFTAAGLPKPAITYWLQAAQLALTRSAYVERLAHLDAALRTIRKLTDPGARQARELEVQNARGGALMATVGYHAKETRQAFVRARELASSVNDPRQTFAALRGLHGVHYSCAEHDAALEVANACLELGRVAEDNDHLALAHRLVGQTHFMRGELSVARRNLEQACALNADVQTNPVAQLTGGGHTLMAPVFLAQVMWVQGLPDQALKLATEALSTAERHYGAFAVTTHLFFLCWLVGWRREYEDLRKHAQRIRHLASEHQISEWDSLSGLLADWPALAQGQGPATAELARSHLSAIRDVNGVMAPYKLGLLARAVATDDPQYGLEIVDEALSLTTQGERWSEAELLRLKGELLFTYDSAAAEDTLRRALDIAQAQGAKSWELRIATTLGECLRERGQKRQGTEALTAICGWFGDASDSVDLRQARRTLQRLT
ncbi:MAG: AAA family ATPase [Gammaproteobacteria bacterium]|nr:AAA family ATPase [Gammaproteobacteria bacterium]